MLIARKSKAHHALDVGHRSRFSRIGKILEGNRVSRTELIVSNDTDYGKISATVQVRP